MDLAHLHLLLNHFPIIGTLIGTGLMAYALLRKDIALQRAVLVLWVLLSIIAIPVNTTGEDAEHRVKKMEGVTREGIHEHEEAAEFALWLMIGLGVVSLAGIVMRGKSSYAMLVKLAFVLSLVVFAAMARTGYLGGLIRHTEFRTGATATESNGTNPIPENGEENDED